MLKYFVQQLLQLIYYSFKKCIKIKLSFGIVKVCCYSVFYTIVNLISLGFWLLNKKDITFESEKLWCAKLIKLETDNIIDLVISRKNYTQLRLCSFWHYAKTQRETDCVQVKETRWEMPADSLMETCQIYHTHAEDTFSRGGVCVWVLSIKTNIDESKNFKNVFFILSVIIILSCCKNKMFCKCFFVFVWF